MLHSPDEKANERNHNFIVTQDPNQSKVTQDERLNVQTADENATMFRRKAGTER
jgi:hypothetical protein